MTEIESDGFITRDNYVTQSEPRPTAELIRRADAIRILAKHFDIVNGNATRQTSVSSLELARMILDQCETVRTE